MLRDRLHIDEGSDNRDCDEIRCRQLPKTPRRTTGLNFLADLGEKRCTLVCQPFQNFPLEAAFAQRAAKKNGLARCYERGIELERKLIQLPRSAVIIM